MPVVPGVSLARDRPVHKVRHVDDRLQRDLGAVERAAARCRAGRELLGATLLALLLALALVLVAAGLIEYFGDLGLERS